MNHAFTIKFASLSLFILVGIRSIPAVVTTFQAPSQITPSALYSVSADDKSVFVYDLLTASEYGIGKPVKPGIAPFVFDGSVKVAVRVLKGFTSVVIRPVSSGIVPIISGDTIKFTLNTPAHLSIEFDGDTKNPLFIFADAPETNVPSSTAAGVRFYGGAKIHELNTLALDSVAGETIYIEGGAIVKGSIVLNQCRNLTVRGSGILISPSGIALSAYNSEGINIDGPIILNEADTATVRLARVKNSTINDCKVIATKGPGIVLTSTRNSFVKNGFICALNDAVRLEGYDEFGFIDSVFRDTVLSSTVWSAGLGSGLAIGPWMLTDVAGECLFKNIEIIHCELPLGIYGEHYSTAAMAIHCGGPAESYGSVEKIRYESIRVEDCRAKHLFNFVLPVYTPVDTWSYPGKRRIKDIYVKDVTVTGVVSRGSAISGLDINHTVEQCTFEGITILGRPILSAENLALETNEFVSNITFLPASGVSSVLTAPESLSIVSTVPAGTARLHWVNKNTGTVAAVIEQASGSDTVFRQVNMRSVGNNEGEVDGLTNGTTYRFRIRFCNGAGCSPYSAAVELKTGAGISVPDDYRIRWRFDGSKAGDNNGPSVTTTGSTQLMDQGYLGSGSLWFNGIDGSCNAGTINLGDTFTLTMWVHQTGKGFRQTLASEGASGTPLNGFNLTINSWTSTDKAVRFETGNSSGFRNAESGLVNVAADGWFHVGITVHKKLGKASVFVNGFDRTVYGSILDNFRTDTVLYLGSSPGGFVLNGYLDDFRIYHRILNADEILALASVPGNTAPVLPGRTISAHQAKSARILGIAIDKQSARRIFIVKNSRFYDIRGRFVSRRTVAPGIYLRMPIRK